MDTVRAALHIMNNPKKDKLDTLELDTVLNHAAVLVSHLEEEQWYVRDIYAKNPEASFVLAAQAAKT